MFADLMTDQTITELALTGVTFDRRIIQPGSLRATIPVPNATVAAEVRKVFPHERYWPPTAGPGRVICHVYRGAQIWGTYLIWTATPAGDERGNVSVEIQGATLESYLDHRQIWTDVPPFVQVDQTAIAQQLIAHMQAGGGAASIGLVPLDTPSGVRRDRTYKASEAATYGQRLAELANVVDGFEYMIRTFVDPATGKRARQFVTAARLGQSDTDHVFTRPGNVVSWSYPSDAAAAATRWRARGDTKQDDLTADSEPLLGSIHTAADLIAAGWPYLDHTEDYQGVTQVATLDDYARWWRDTRSGVIRIPQARVRLDEAPSFTPDRLGDFARLTIVDVWFPLDRSEGAYSRPTFSRHWRVVGIEVTPVSREDSQELATLIFAEQADEEAA
ncbi:hypothetical protein SMC26_40270 [Actinomadura fulvescens]|uniref:hypothetical protein n=1 Tax=Actinomadura fulvescens TaxID=46160 RepID=UPI0031D00167